MFKIILTILFALSISEINAITAINVRFSEQGYWYAKAFNSDPDLPNEACSWACMDSMELKSKAALDFFQNKLPKDSPELKKLEFWAHICGKA